MAVIAILCISLMFYYVRQAEIEARTQKTLEDLEDANSQEVGEVRKPKASSKVEVNESENQITITIKK